jgi:hypothetical protein
VHPDVAGFLTVSGARSLEALEALIDRPVTVEPAADLGPSDAEVTDVP